MTDANLSVTDSHAPIEAFNRRFKYLVFGGSPENSLLSSSPLPLPDNAQNRTTKLGPQGRLGRCPQGSFPRFFSILRIPKPVSSSQQNSALSSRTYATAKPGLSFSFLTVQRAYVRTSVVSSPIQFPAPQLHPRSLQYWSPASLVVPSAETSRRPVAF